MHRISFTSSWSNSQIKKVRKINRDKEPFVASASSYSTRHILLSKWSQLTADFRLTHAKLAARILSPSYRGRSAQWEAL